jgi:predicted acyl esterase
MRRVQVMKKNESSQPIYGTIVEGLDIMVPTRDGTRLAADVYRPDAKGPFPALLAIAPHNKFLQRLEVIEACNNQPAWAPLWCGPAEGGDTKFLTSRGYVHVIANLRGFGNSDPGDAFAESSKLDSYDMIEWIAAQPWCDGNVGMLGISWFARKQMRAAVTQPPHLKAIFPYDPQWISFREMYPGGLVHAMLFHLMKFSAEIQHEVILTPEEEDQWKEAFDNPDYRMYPHIFNVLERRGKLGGLFFKHLINPYDPDHVDELEEEVKKINIPVYMGTGWYAYTYKCHLFGNFRYWEKCTNAPFKKMLLSGPAHLPRPWIAFHDEMLRWYDYWLKGIDTGIKDEPRIKIWVMGANRWRHTDDWPLKETEWTKLYLDSWERLRWEPFIPSSKDGIDAPDCFAQMPLTQTRKVQSLRYMTDPLPQDMEITGPLSLHFWAEIDQEDTNWIIILKDVGPDVSVQTAREGEMERPQVPEREVTRGWLKASHRAVDESKSSQGRPFHPLTRKAQKPVEPGKITKYDVEIAPTSNVFKRDHRICVELTSLDIPTGVAGDAAVEYISYHLCSSKTVVHKVYRCQQYPSHLLLPVIPQNPA